MLNKKNYFDLKGINALVTGCTGHLGESISLCLAENGANVYLNGRNKKKIILLKNKINNRGYNFCSAIFDITKEKQVKNFLKIKKLRYNYK